MSLTVTHAKVSAIADDPAASAAGEVLPSDWNAAHIVTGAMSVFNVADYGAVGDGSNDDTAAIQAALDAANAAGGGTVWIPEGTYKISNSLIVYSDTHVRGAGRGATTLRGTAGAYVGKTINGGSAIYCTIAMATANRSSVKSLTVDHVTNAATANGIGILCDGTEVASTMCVIEDCEVLGHVSHQYMLWNFKGIDSKIVNNYVNGGSSTEDGTLDQVGINCYGGSNVLISGNTVKNIESSGIRVGGDATYGYPTNVLIDGNTISVSYVGVNIIANAYNVRVSNNYVGSSWAYGISATSGASSTLDDISIIANTVKTAEIGIYCAGESGATCKSMLIAENSVSGATLASGAGIVVQRLSYCGVVNNSVVDSAGNGIFIESADDGLVDGNVIINSELHGIYLLTVDRSSVLNNRLDYFNDALGTNYGVYAVTCTYLNIDGNSFNSTNATYPVYVSSGDHNTIGSGNKLLRTYNLSPVFRNTGTHPSRGAISISANAVTTYVYNDLANYSSIIHLQQTAGPVLPVTVAVSTGTITLTHAAAAGTETFDYEVK